jgi:hypothetical protein
MVFLGLVDTVSFSTYLLIDKPPITRRNDEDISLNFYIKVNKLTKMLLYMF